MLAALCRLFIMVILPWFPGLANSPQQGGVNRETFEKIRVGMTVQQIEGQIGKPFTIMVAYDGPVCMATFEWLDGAKYIVVCCDQPSKDENVSTEGKVFHARFQDTSATPLLTIEILRSSTIIVTNGPLLPAPPPVSTFKSQATADDNK
jgi:hypothetical protein